MILRTRFRHGGGRWYRFGAVLLAVSLATLGLGMPHPAASGAAPSATQGALATAGDGCDWCAEWAVTYDTPSRGPNDSGAVVSDSVLSPAGDLLFVAGLNQGPRKDFGDFNLPPLTLLVGAFNAGTGERVWAAEHALGFQDNSLATHIAVSPDGRTAYVANVEAVSRDSQREIVIAYNTARPEQPSDPKLGERLWVVTGAAHRSVLVRGLAVTPDGSTVLSAGAETVDRWDDQLPQQMVISATTYDAATGEQRWHSHYASPVPADGEAPPGTNVGNGIAVSPDGEFAYVTGYVWPTGAIRPVTLAFHVRGESAGELRWVSEFIIPVETGDRAGQGGYTKDSFFGDGIVVSEDGSRVFVTGFSTNDPSGGMRASRILTIAYDAATGDQLWWSGFGMPLAGLGLGALLGQSPGQHLPSSIAVSADDGSVFVVGTHKFNNVASSVVVAYAQETGAQRWARIGDAGGFSSVTSSPDGTMVYAPADLGGALLAYDSGAGAPVASADLGEAFPNATELYATVALASRDGTRVFVGGEVRLSGRRDVVWAIASYATPGFTPQG